MTISAEPFPREGVTPVTFTVDNLEASRRLDAWNAAFGSLNEISLPVGDNQPPSVCNSNWLFGGGLVLSETKIRRAHFFRDTQRVRRDQLDHWVMRVLRQGRARLQHGGFEAVTGPGDLVLFSIDETWMVEWEDVEWVSVTIPRDYDLRLSLGLAALPHGTLGGAGAALLADVMLSLPARVATAQPREVAGLVGVLHAAVSACVLGAKSQDPSEAVVASVDNLAKYRVQRAIMHNLKSARLTPATLAVQAGMSRSALYRLFEAEGGVARYIRNMRLSLAHAALCDPAMAGQSIAAIAEAHGFPDPPEFSRAFRSQYGMSPREVRATLKAGAPFLSAGPRRKGVAGHDDIAMQIYTRG